MKSVRIGLVGILLLGCVNLAGSDMGIQGQDFDPPHIFPLKDRYVTRVDDTLIVTLNVIFPATSGSCIETVEWEIASPSRGFTTVTPTFIRTMKRSEGSPSFIHHMALLIIAPKKGDAGEYDIRVWERRCPGPRGTGTVLPFRISVKGK